MAILLLLPSLKKKNLFPQKHSLEFLGSYKGGILCVGSNMGTDFDDQ